MRTPDLLAACLLTTCLAAAAEQVLFEDRFETRPDAGWRWLREDAHDWCVREGGLEIRLRPGDAHSVRNALVRPAPDRRQGPVAIEVTVTSHRVPTQQFEQAGITWYNDGQPVFKLVKELVDGQRMIIPGRASMMNASVQLRVVVTDRAWAAYYRPGSEGPFLPAGSGELPPAAQEEVSIQGYHGPPDAEHWVRFDDFRVLRLHQ